MTYAKWLMAAAETLQRDEVDRAEAHLRARLLLAEVTGCTHPHLLEPNSELDAPALESLAAMLEQAKLGRPLSYILGYRDFYGRRYRCDERALIPRPETELLVEQVLQLACRLSNPKIADMGTGTGCIAITLALELPGARVFATDISCKARSLAEENAAELGAPVTFLAGFANDWVAPLQYSGPYDILVSNPPYIAAGDIDALQREIASFEPRAALDGGTDGLDPYRQIAQGAVGLLRPGGWVALELGAGQFQQVEAFFVLAGAEVAPAVADLQGHQRVLLARF